MNDIFKTMDIPQLGDPNFQTQFETFCDALIQNILRLISVQYTKGEKGDSVITEEYTSNYRIDEQEISTGNLDAMGMAIVSAIFGDTPQGTTRTDLYNMLNGSLATIQVGDDYYYSQGIAPGIIVDGVEYNAIEDLIRIVGDACKGITTNITIDPVNGEAWLSSPYLFIDGRIQGLNRMVRRNGHDEEYYKTFHDFSTAIYGSAKYEEDVEGQDRNNPLTWTWTMEAVPIVPKLYFDQDINEFCWEVNGQQTGITAQGIKGDDGIAPTTIIGSGTKQDSIITIDTYQYLDTSGNLRWTRRNPNWPNPNNPDEPMFLKATGDTTPMEIEDPKDGDLALVFFNPSNDPSDPYLDAYLGRVYINSTNPYVVIGWDNQGRCDIFESIRQHDFWRMMVTINESIEGSPRGYILPADQNIHAYPDTPATKAHLAYSESSNADSDGFGVLHMAPVNASDTHHNTNDPQTDHIGEMVVDYNVHVQGNHSVQGVTNVNDLHVQGNAEMHQNLNVQGDVTVQGNITAANITATGKQFPTVISNTRLASMSKFKDVSYKVTRTATNPDSTTGEHGKVSYSVAINGTLEVNIGRLSKYDQDQCIQGVHRAISGYNADWSDDSSKTGERNECNQSDAYKDTECREKSKLYDVVTYNIPFSINKKAKVNMNYDPNRGNTGNGQVFGFKSILKGEMLSSTEIMDNASTWEAQGTVIPASLVSDQENNLFCKVAAFKKWYKSDNQTNILDRGSLWDKDIDNTEISSLYYGYLGWPWRETQGQPISQGAVSNLVGLTEINITPNPDFYTISGRLHYAPLNIDINYCFDLFTRILESDIADPQPLPIPGEWWYYKSLNYNILLSITPVGCLYLHGIGNPYMAPIWNAINTKNVSSNSLKAFIDVGGGISKSEINYTTLHSLVNDRLEYVYAELIGSNDSNDSNNLLIYPAEPNTNINGPIETIMRNLNVESGYIMSVFEQYNSATYGVTAYNSGSIQSNCFDITPNIMIVSDNAKVCPNNAKDGVWHVDTSVVPHEASWTSNDDIPVCVIPCEGYVGKRHITPQIAGHLKIGCASPRKAFPDLLMPEKFAMSLSGVLMYPYTPCLIMKSSGGTVDTMADGNDDASEGGLHYISTGRMMGINEGNINGMVSQVTQQSQDWGDDRSDIEL